MLDHWHEFYALVGTAAAALLALLFVAASIGARTMPRESGGPTRTYMSPVAFHFTAVLFVSALALVPSLSPASLAAVLACTISERSLSRDVKEKISPPNVKVGNDRRKMH